MEDLECPMCRGQIDIEDKGIGWEFACIEGHCKLISITIKAQNESEAIKIFQKLKMVS